MISLRRTGAMVTVGYGPALQALRCRDCEEGTPEVLHAVLLGQAPQPKGGLG